MQFRVSGTAASDSGVLLAALRPVPRIAEPSAVLTRRLTLDENLNEMMRPYEVLPAST